VNDGLVGVIVGVA